MTDSSGDEEVVAVQFALPQAHVFFRHTPAELEEPRQVWIVALETIDYAAALLLARGKPREGKSLRDSVLLALLRRATITTEGVVVLLRSGLFEPALSIRRTLLDIELSIKLIVADPTDRMAKRLAAYHYLNYRRHGEDLLANATTRAESSDVEGTPARLRAVTRSYARFLKMDVFSDVRAELGVSRHWHGYKTTEDAFEAAASVSDYLNLYDSATGYVHASNLDADFIDRHGEELRIRPFVERDPVRNHLFLGETLFALYRILKLLLVEHPDARFTETEDSANKSAIDSFSGLQLRLLNAFKHTASDDAGAA